MGMIRDIIGSLGNIIRHENRESEQIIIRVKEGYHAGMKIEYGWTAKPLADFLEPSKETEKLPDQIKVIIDVPEDIEEKDIKIAPIGKKLIVKIPGRRKREIDLPYNVKDVYETALKNNILFIFLGRDKGYGRNR